MLKKCSKNSLRQNYLKIGLFVGQAENQYFWGHSSVVLQFMAHFCYSFKVSSATEENTMLLPAVWMWRNRTLRKKTKSVPNALVWHLHSQNHWPAQLYIINNSLQTSHFSFSFQNPRHVSQKSEILSHFFLTYTNLSPYKQQQIDLFIYNFSSWPHLVAFHIIYRPICRIFCTSKLKNSTRDFTVFSQLCHCKFQWPLLLQTSEQWHT